jgi:quinol monooxygenase YgiN
MKPLIAILVTVASLNVAIAKSSQNEERVLIAYMKVLPGTENQFLKAAENVIKESRRESGNIRYQLHQSVTNPQQFVFYELFSSDADLQYHRKARHTVAFLKQTKPYTVQFTLEEYIPEGELE